MRLCEMFEMKIENMFVAEQYILNRSKSRISIPMVVPQSIGLSGKDKIESEICPTTLTYVNSYLLLFVR
jgi:hypothetical protein